MLKALSRLFTRRKEYPQADLGSLCADMHSHLIPGIDDGAKTIEDSMRLIRGLCDAGYQKIITTPHIMSDYYRNTPEIILGGLEQVRNAIREEGLQVSIEAAAEYYIDDGFMRKLDEERLMTFGDQYLLVEVSYINPPDSIHAVLFKAQTLGYRPVLAHPERYPYWYHDIEQYRMFYEKGVTLQLNINSLSGYYGPEAKRIAEKLIELDLVGAIGTDMHHDRHLEALQHARRSPALHALLERPLLNREL